ncbi:MULTISPECIES: pyrimidine utilization protein D [unclassified Vibrio]|uniref:Putative carbamate hydrolase RutD n=1 Tax=Vibrio sp. HB236076 TaxID=3232307 RepID=A0AB39HJR9_9VIBR|nr:pyrimidine utilization protein D [Vibrio sp. HB161653]MDP5252760.1 pyrimidine utilization protein D [Vibrio sp. HB161653]
MVFYQTYPSIETAKGTVVLSSGLGGSHLYWQPQVASLQKNFNVVVYDHLGTGRSKASLPDDYHIKDMAKDVLELIDDVNQGPVHFIGHAIGGLIGLEAAAMAPEKLASLVLVNAWDKTDAHTKRCFEIRKSILVNTGLEMYLKAQPLFLYPAQWMKEHRAELDQELAHLLKADIDTDNLKKRIKAAEQYDGRDKLSAIKTPTAVIVSLDDLLVPFSCSAQLFEQLDNAQLFEMNHGGHACNLTRAKQFNALLDDFYQQQIH